MKASLEKPWKQCARILDLAARLPSPQSSVVGSFFKRKSNSAM